MLLLFLIGCGGGSSGSSYSSDWIGITSDPSSQDYQVEIKPSATSVRPEQSIPLAVLVKDAYGHPLDEIALQFSSQLGGTFDDQTGNTSKGWFSTRFTAGKTAGTEVITVAANGVSASKSILVKPADPQTTVISIVTSSNTSLAGTPVTLAVGVTVDGQPSSDANVFLASTIPGSFSPDSGTVSSGWFTSTFTPDSGASGVGTITAMVGGTISSSPISVVKQKKDVPQLAVSVNPGSVFQDQTAAVIVMAMDSAGFPANSEIYLSCSLDGAFASNSGTPVDGVFYTEFTAGKEVGSATITAFSLGASASTILSIERPQIVMKITPSSSSVKVGETIPVSVLVTDTYLRPISGASVFMAAELGCYLDPSEGTTNDEGYMFANFVAGQTAGTAKINGLTSGAASSAQLTVVGP
ncbi:MAG: hypothetical protein Kow0029_15880 [Candidatus Rifleibacteriota bacterium]